MNMWDKFLLNFHANIRVYLTEEHPNGEKLLLVNASTGSCLKFMERFGKLDFVLRFYYVIKFLHLDRQMSDMLHEKVESNKIKWQIEWYTSCIMGI